ncbi:MAG TPA: RagB/SusD family nutrient uptake outer membrane protein [Longimicrobiales bacterium]
MISATACDLSLNDPNIPTEDEVLGSSENMIRVGIGLQAEYSNQLAEPVYVTGMVTNELGANTSTFESFRILDTGSGPATNDLGASISPWTGQYRVVRHADFLITNAPTTVGLGPGYISGLVALGKLYKAMALGNLIQIYEQIVIVPGLDAAFVDRTTAMTTILTLLDEAAAQLASVPPAPEFSALVPAPGFNLANTIQAMRARYNLIAGNLTIADAAAAAVSPTVFSEFRFSDSDPNPLWNLYVAGGNSTSMRPKDAWRLAAEAGDQRIAYWVVPAALTGFAAPLDNFNQYSLRTHSYPAYLPDEMTLIRAEVAARENRLTDALGYVNAVRTQCASALPEPVACLPALTLADVPTQQAMLDEILRQRRFELYLQHLRWSDLRRFGEPVKYEWMPIPVTECDRNASTPPDLCLPEPADPTVVD